MPGRDLKGDYRYAYQGQEVDPETGKEAFELRLWDARIGRWLTTDPYGQFASPYLGMGNNPVRFIDPDGGICKDVDGNIIPCGGHGSEFDGPTNEALNILDEVIITYSKSGANGQGNFSGADFAGNFDMAADILLPIVGDDLIPKLYVNDFKLQRYDPKVGYDIVPNYLGQVFQKGTNDAIKSVSNVRTGVKILGSITAPLDYYDAFEGAINMDVNATAAGTIKGVGATASNYVPILGPLVYEGVWSFGDNYLIDLSV